MPTITQRPTPSQSIAIDTIGNEVYASHYAERRMAKWAIGCLAVALVASLGTVAVLAHRPVRDRFIRIDEMGRAQAIQYSDLNYTPREGEVRTYLMDWATDRYTITKDTIATRYPQNYYFLAQPLASQLMRADSANHLVSRVQNGQIEQDEAQVTSVVITSMSTQTIHGDAIAKGTASINLTKTFSPEQSQQPRVEYWVISVTYYLNPAQVDTMSQVYPQFETINPLGLTITQYEDNRVAVKQTPVDAALPAAGAPQ